MPLHAHPWLASDVLSMLGPSAVILLPSISIVNPPHILSFFFFSSSASLSIVFGLFRVICFSCSFCLHTSCALCLFLLPSLLTTVSNYYTLASILSPVVRIFANSPNTCSYSKLGSSTTHNLLFEGSGSSSSFNPKIHKKSTITSSILV